MSEAKSRIGWIGLGKMGLPIACRIKAAGHEVTVYGRNDASRKRASDVGFAAVKSYAELARTCDVVFASISDDKALLDVVASEHGLAASLHKSQIFVETSTVSPAVSAQAADMLKPKGIGYLCAPLSGSTAMAEAGTLTVIASGPRSTFDELAPVFELFSKKQFYVGDSEQSRYLKLAINTMVAAMSSLMAEALTFGRKGGLDVATMLEVIGNSAVATPILQYKRETLVKQDFTPAFTVEQMMKDLDIALSVGRTTHCPLPLTSQIRQQYETAYAHGEGKLDYFVLYKHYARMAGFEA